MSLTMSYKLSVADALPAHTRDLIGASGAALPAPACCHDTAALADPGTTAGTPTPSWAGLTADR